MSTSKEAIREEVLRASQKWVDSFNRGDADSISQTYHDDAAVHVVTSSTSPLTSPKTGFRGRQRISEFWGDVMRQQQEDSGTSPQAQVRDVTVEPLDESSCVLQRSASMGRGDVVSEEKWVKSVDGDWKVAEDKVTLVESFSDL